MLATLVTQMSLPQTLRWTRRTFVVLLIIANFLAVILADAGRAVQYLP